MTSNQLIKKIQTKCPKFSAVTLSMIRHSDDYGIIFSPKALSCLNLSYTEVKEDAATKCIEKNKTSQKRRKQQQKLTNEQEQQLKQKLKTTNKTKQEYVLELIRKDLENG